MSTPSTDTAVQDGRVALSPADIAVRISEFIEVVEEHIHEGGLVDVDERAGPDQVEGGPKPRPA